MVLFSTDFTPGMGTLEITYKFLPGYWIQILPRKKQSRITMDYGIIVCLGPNTYIDYMLFLMYFSCAQLFCEAWTICFHLYSKQNTVKMTKKNNR